MAQPEPLSLAGRRVAFTTPQTTGSGYGARLHALLRQRGEHPLPVPTIATRPSDPDRLRPFLLPGALDPFVVLAFTSISGISAFSRALPSSSAQRPLSDAASALPFTVATLGSDADLLDGTFLTRLCCDAGRVAVLVPYVPTAAGLVEALGRGSGRRVLCPVPDVVGLREPPVVLRLSRRAGGGRVGGRAGAGVHHMLGRAGPHRAAGARPRWRGCSRGWTPRVGWPRIRARWPKMVVAAHGPVTADGVRGLSIEVDVVSSSRGSEQLTN